MTRKNRLKAKVGPFAKHTKAAGDVTRMSVLYLLAQQGPLDVWQILEYTGVAPSLMSHHLKILFGSGWVTKKKYGKKIEYKLNPKAFFELQKLFEDTQVGREVFRDK